MKTYLDTNILYYGHSGKKQDVILEGQLITSINALEFLKNIEKVHTNRAKYHIPRTNSYFHQRELIAGKEYFKKRNHPINKRLSDSIIFDFAHDFESYALYNNESISQVINNKYKELFYLTISFLKKAEYKDIRGKFDFILNHELQCECIKENDIDLAYDLLGKFLKEHSLKNDFRNCWNDILILSKTINEGGKLITSDKLLNKFACEVYDGKIVKTDGVLEINFPIENEHSKKYKTFESKGYVNRSWNYKIRQGN